MSTTIILNKKEITKQEIPEKLELSFAYPDVRFHCPFCGSLDVYLNIDAYRIIASINCLECNKKWRND